MAELFQRDKSVISRHISNVFEEGEWKRDSVVADFATTAADGKTYQKVFWRKVLEIYGGYVEQLTFLLFLKMADEVRVDAAISLQLARTYVHGYGVG